MTLKELKQKWANKEKIIWNDPQPLEGNDYTLSYLEDIDEKDFSSDTPILIQYNNGGSEAEVWLHELSTS